MDQLNIVELIENNPITKLSNDYNVKLLVKIKKNFTDMEQQLFLSSFYCYLNYHPTNDFVVDLDNVWKWLGFTLKENSKRMLTKHFNVNVDFKNLARQHGGASSDEQGKTVEKREISKNIILGTWETIAKAAQSENISAAKMSRSIKNKILFEDYYYCLSK